MIYLLKYEKYEKHVKNEDEKCFLESLIDELNSHSPVNLIFRDYGFQIDPCGKGAEVWHLGEMVGKLETVDHLFFNFQLKGKPFIEQLSEIEYE